MRFQLSVGLIGRLALVECALLGVSGACAQPTTPPAPAPPGETRPEAPLTAQLDEAIVARDRTRVAHLLKQGADPNAAWVGWRPLVRAIIRNDVETVRLLLHAGAWPAPKDVFTPLVAAVRMNNSEIVAVLLDAGADPNERSGAGGGETPLMNAVEADAADSCGTLLDRGADVNSWNLWPRARYQNTKFEPGTVRGRTPLMAAAALGRKDLVYKLLCHGAQAELRNELGETALSVTREYVSPIPEIRQLLRHPPKR